MKNKSGWMGGWAGAAVLALVLGSGAAFAAPISCDAADATANGAVADACAGDDALGANGAVETGFVNGQWAPEPFSFIGKYEFTENAFEPGSLDGFVLDVSVDGGYPESSDYLFRYTLTVPEAWVGEVVDWVLGIKQGSNQFIAYLFEDVTLGIQGGYNNFWVNGGGREVNDFSHASGWIRASDTPPGELPIPGVLGLFALGLLLLGLSRVR